MVRIKAFLYLTARYNKDCSITLYATDGNKTHELKIIGFKPYFYVPVDDHIPEGTRGSFEHQNITSIELEPLNPDGSFVSNDGAGEYKHEDGFPVKKIVVSHPMVVRHIRDTFTAHYEADIKFIRRFLIDTGIYSGFMIMSNNLDRPIHYSELKPIESKDLNIPLVTSYIDFEMEVTTRFPDPKNPKQEVTAWTAWDNKNHQYLTCVLSDKCEVKKWAEDWTVVFVDKEETLFHLFNKYLEDTQPHLITGWNVEVPDIAYPRARAREFGIELIYNHSDQLDLCKAYQKVHRRLYNRLKDVAVEEEIYDPTELVADEYHKDMRKKNLKKFIKYNKMDVEILVKLDQKGWYGTDEDTEEKVFEPPRKLCSFFWMLKNYVGIESCQAMLRRIRGHLVGNGVLIDTLMLRKAHNRFVLNSTSSGEGKSYPGAVVFEPPEGVFPEDENSDEVLAVIDMSRYYPYIILGYKIDKLACEVIEDLNLKRDEYETIMRNCKIKTPEYNDAEYKRDVVKFLLNTNYGYLGSPYSRKYKRDKAHKITSKAVLGLEVIRDATEAETPELLTKLNKYTSLDKKKGFPVRTGDTDSLIVQCKPNEVAKIVWYLNEIILKEHCKAEGIPPLLRLKHEKTAPRGLFVKAKSGRKAAKKRYGLWITWKDGKKCDFIDITGFDYVRGNSSKITRKLQMFSIKALLKTGKSGIPKYIHKLIEEVKSGKYSPIELAIPINLRKPLNKYTKTKPDYVRGSIWAKEHLSLEIIGGDRVKMIYAIRPYDRICFFDKEDLEKIPNLVLDYPKIIDATIRKKSEQFLRLGKYSWRDVEGHAELSEVFGI